MKTVGGKLPSSCQLLIQGAGSKLNINGEIIDEPILRKLNNLVLGFIESMKTAQERA